MHLTLHLTNACNFCCTYCYVHNKSPEAMSLATAQLAIQLALDETAMKKLQQPIGIVFFGGEPLLCKDLIREIIKHCCEIEETSGQQFSFKLTTNGSLLDESFLTDPYTSRILIAISHDGVEVAHNRHRRDAAGNGTFEQLQPNLALLLKHQPYAPVLQVINPNTVPHFLASVDYLYQTGFRYIISTLNYRTEWTETDFDFVEKQYKKLAKWYEALTLQEKKFYFSPFDAKIATHIFGVTCDDRCEFGRSQISVAPDGGLYPCVQFVDEGRSSRFCIGDVYYGIDELLRTNLARSNETVKTGCEECAVKLRCNHYCGCVNYATTGSINRISPYLCAHERIVLPIADRLAEKLYKKRAALFMQKQYNKLYPLLSLVEDRSAVRNS